MNVSPVCPLKTFYPDSSIFPVTKVHIFEEGRLQERKTETYSSQEECHPFFPKHQNTGCVLRTKSKKNPSTTAFYLGSNVSPHLPLAWPYCTYCACQDKKKSVTVQNKYLTLRQAQSSRPAETWAVCTCHDLCSAVPLQQPMTQHTLTSRVRLLSPNCSKCYWPQQSSKGNANLFASRHLKNETKPCISATFPSKVYLQFCEKRGQIAFYHIWI